MSGDGTGFTPQFRQILGAEQRRSVLTAIGDELTPSTTIGEIVDAASTLGWHDGVGQLRLIDLAEVLLREAPAHAANETTAPAPKADDDDDDVDDAPAAQTSKKTNKKTSKKAAASKPAATKKTTKAAAKAGKGKVPSKEAFDERMSLDEAIAAFVPLVESIGEATMADLEEATGLGRRKLRFHIGQLVKHGHLTRHGMGRGTFYTV